MLFCSQTHPNLARLVLRYILRHLPSHVSINLCTITILTKNRICAQLFYTDVTCEESNSCTKNVHEAIRCKIIFLDISFSTSFKCRCTINISNLYKVHNFFLLKCLVLNKTEYNLRIEIIFITCARY